MSTTDALGNVNSERSSAILQIVFFLSPFLTAAIPKLTWLFLILVPAALIGRAFRRSEDWRGLILPDTTLTIFVLVALYVAINATWAAATGPALEKAGLLLGVIVITLAANNAISRLDERHLHHAAVAFAAGAFFGVVLILFELLSGGAISRTAMNLLPLAHSHKHMVFAEDEVTGLQFSYLNRNVAILGLYLWPALLAMRTFRDATWRWVVSSFFLIAATVSIFVSEHQSSQVGLLGAVLVFILTSRWPKTTIRGIAVVWCLAFALALPVALLAYKADLNTARWLPVSFRDRIAIWDDTAERALKDPWFGIGARSTRVLMNEPIVDEPTNSVRRKSAGWHAHDLFLQTWYELGVIGVILIAIAGAAVALRIAVLSTEAQPVAAAAYTFFMAIAAFAWDMWQTWLVCAMALTLIYLSIAAMNFDAAKQT